MTISDSEVSMVQQQEKMKVLVASFLEVAQDLVNAVSEC